MTKNNMRAFGAAAAIGAAVAAAIWASHAMAQTSAGPFTEAQAQAGQPLYVSRGAGCHDAGGETARLMGPAFTEGAMGVAQHSGALYPRIKTTMPFSNPGSLSRSRGRRGLLPIF